MRKISVFCRLESIWEEEFRSQELQELQEEEFRSQELQELQEEEFRSQELQEFRSSRNGRPNRGGHINGM